MIGDFNYHVNSVVWSSLLYSNLLKTHKSLVKQFEIVSSWPFWPIKTVSWIRLNKVAGGDAVNLKRLVAEPVIHNCASPGLHPVSRQYLATGLSWKQDASMLPSLAFFFSFGAEDSSLALISASLTHFSGFGCQETKVLVCQVGSGSASSPPALGHLKFAFQRYLKVDAGHTRMERFNWGMFSLTRN